jgi:thiamine-phosphate pyrophosphorylase
MIPFPLRGLYAITQSENITDHQLISNVEAAIKGGAAVIQYRDKRSSNHLMLAHRLVELCHHYAIPLIINDNIDLMLHCGADGVHLGKDDGDIAHARQRLGNNAIIGVSCYNSLDRALTAQHQGATYVAFGRFFPSSSKPLASPADISTLTCAKAKIRLPLVAIGGILPDNGSQLLQAGADLLAVIGGIFDNDPETSVKEYCALFTS